jgi:hypothetical protein
MGDSHDAVAKAVGMTQHFVVHFADVLANATELNCGPSLAMAERRSEISYPVS